MTTEKSVAEEESSAENTAPKTATSTRRSTRSTGTKNSTRSARVKKDSQDLNPSEDEAQPQKRGTRAKKAETEDAGGATTRRSTRRTTRKASAEAGTEATESPAAEAAPSAEASAAESAPKTRRRSSTRTSSRTAARQDTESGAGDSGESAGAGSAQDSSATPATAPAAPQLPVATLLFQAPDLSLAVPAPATRSRKAKVEEEVEEEPKPTRKRATRRSKEDKKNAESPAAKDENTEKARAEVVAALEKAIDAVEESDSSRRRRRRRRGGDESTEAAAAAAEVTALKGSTRLEAKRQRRREGRREGRKRTPITEAEFLARRESVRREMLVREKDGLNQIAVLEDGLLVEHYVSRHTQTTMVGNIYLGKVQNVLPSMEAAFVDLGKGRNAVLYAGEVNWDAAGMNGKVRRIEDALSPGDNVLVQVTKDPIGHKGARLTSQITLAGRHLVLVPSGAMTGISRKLPEEERNRLKAILKEIVPAGHGVIVRTAAEGATEEQLREDVERLERIWKDVTSKQEKAKSAPVLLHGEPELAVRVVRDIFNEDFKSLTVQGEEAWKTISKYVTDLSPELKDRLVHWKGEDDVFAAHRVDEQLAKGFERKVWLPSGGYLIIDRTEAMSVIDVNTGKFTGSGGTLEETVTKNNLEAAEEIVRQLRLRDIGGIVVIDFVDMVLESNRELVLRRLVECLGRDRTRHQVTEVTSLGLVQMTRKRVGQGLVEAFSTTCECCNGRGFIVHDAPVEHNGQAPEDVPGYNNSRSGSGRSKKRSASRSAAAPKASAVEETKPEVRQTMSAIAKAAASSHQVQEAPAAPPERPSRSRQSVKPVTETSETPGDNVSAGEEQSSATRPRRRRRAASTGIITTDQDPREQIVVTSH